MRKASSVEKETEYYTPCDRGSSDEQEWGQFKVGEPGQIGYLSLDWPELACMQNYPTEPRRMPPLTEYEYTTSV